MKEAKWRSLRSWATGQAESPLPVSCSGGRHGKSTGADGLTPGTLGPALCQGAVSVKGWRVRATRLVYHMPFPGWSPINNGLSWAAAPLPNSWMSFEDGFCFPGPLTWVTADCDTTFSTLGPCFPLRYIFFCIKLYVGLAHRRCHMFWNFTDDPAVVLTSFVWREMNQMEDLKDLLTFLLNHSKLFRLLAALSGL